MNNENAELAPPHEEHQFPHLPNEESFLNRITSKDVLTISSDFFPSVIFIGFILYALVTNRNFCDNAFPQILRAMMFIYSAFVLKSIIHTILIYRNSQDANASKISLSTMDFLLNLAYYVAVLVSYIIYKNRGEECFIQSTFPTILLFVLIMIGIVNLARHVLNIFMIVLCFPIMVYYFLRNPQSFYSNFGIDPEIVRNLPTIKAGPQHATNCAICSEDILEGEDILVLRCPGRHFFHGNCIKNWLIVKVMCPMCRYENVL